MVSMTCRADGRLMPSAGREQPYRVRNNHGRVSATRVMQMRTPPVQNEANLGGDDHVFSVTWRLSGKPLHDSSASLIGGNQAAFLGRLHALLENAAGCRAYLNCRLVRNKRIGALALGHTFTVARCKQLVDGSSTHRVRAQHLHVIGPPERQEQPPLFERLSLELSGEASRGRFRGGPFWREFPGCPQAEGARFLLYDKYGGVLSCSEE